MIAWWAVLVLGVSIWTLSVPVSANMENKLINDLLNMSEKNARPLKKSSDILAINFDTTFQTFAIDEKSHVLTNIGYETLSWRNEILVWDPELYAGIGTVFLDQDSIWTPDMSLFNPAGEVDVQYGQGNLVLRSNGDVLMVRISKSKVVCDMNTLHFPFDVVNCSFIFGSWVYSGEKINLTLMNKQVDLSDLRPNPTWTVKSVKAVKETKIYPCCPENYYSILYTAEFHRNASHYSNVLLFPCFLLSILTILLFLLPTHSSERISLGILLFCAFFLLLVYTSSLVADWHRIPYFVIFLIFNLVVITLFTFLHSFIIRLSLSEGCQEIPKIVRTFMFDVLARILCMKSTVQRNRSGYGVAPESPELTDCFKKTEKQHLYPAPTVDAVDESPDGKRSLEADVASIRALTTRLGQKAETGAKEKKLSREWKDLAAVVNKFFLVIYMVVVIVAIVVAYIQVSDH